VVGPGPRAGRAERPAPPLHGKGREMTVSSKDGMTKAELVEEVARVTQLTKKHAEIIVNKVFDSIVDSLKDGEKIELRGFGSFRIRHRGARTGRNPKTGDRVKVPPKRIPYFKPGKELRELLNDEC
jgi:integration host factor subunit beta